jgi:hypothetical protein
MKFCFHNKVVTRVLTEKGNGEQLGESCSVKSWLYQPEEEHNIQDKIALPENTESGAELG